MAASPKGNHPDLSYRGGQRPIVHLEADLHTVVQWAEGNNCRWAFSKSNAGARYTRFFQNLAQLDEINWGEVATRDFCPIAIKEGKQTEQRITAMLRQTGQRTVVSIQRDWYY